MKYLIIISLFLLSCSRGERTIVIVADSGSFGGSQGCIKKEIVRVPRGEYTIITRSSCGPAARVKAYLRREPLKDKLIYDITAPTHYIAINL